MTLSNVTGSKSVNGIAPIKRRRGRPFGSKKVNVGKFTNDTVMITVCLFQQNSENNYEWRNGKQW